MSKLELDATGRPAAGSEAQNLAQQIADFAQPLLEGATTPAATSNALAMGEFFWRLALAKDARSRADWLDILLKAMAQSESDRANLRALAAKMVVRHQEMFPALHGTSAGPRT